MSEQDVNGEKNNYICEENKPTSIASFANCLAEMFRPWSPSLKQKKAGENCNFQKGQYSNVTGVKNQPQMVMKVNFRT